jgi:gliding motility-associated protein GldM
MADAKASPRQKMINMMYLVLTALLALNVSKEVLQSFETLGISLRESAKVVTASNHQFSDQIKDAVTKEVESGNKKNEKLIALTDTVMGKSKTVFLYLQGIIDMLGSPEYGNADPVTHSIEVKDESVKNTNFWLGIDDAANGGRGNGEAMKLKEILNGYVAWANKFLAEELGDSTSFKKICLEPSEDPTLAHSSHGGEVKSWEYFTFHDVPLIANIALLEKYKSDINTIETKVLNAIKLKLSNITFKIDSLIAIDAPVSQIVPAGLQFETKLFVSMASSEIKPQFEGGGITTDPSGNFAIMKIGAQGGFAEGVNERKQGYSASIKVPKADGTFALLPVKGEFTVRKPEVVITSKSVQNLYRACGNKINIDVPALGDLYNPSISASGGADAIQDPANKKVFTIVPQGKECIVGVTSNTNGQNLKIDDIKYSVIAPPRPQIQIIVNGKIYDGSTPIPKKSTLTVKIVPDKEFLEKLPADARYEIGTARVLVQRGLGVPKEVTNTNASGKDARTGISVPLGTSLQNDNAGTKIYVVVDKIYRVNFKSQKVEENFIETERMVGAVIQ